MPPILSKFVKKPAHALYYRKRCYALTEHDNIFIRNHTRKLEKFVQLTTDDDGDDFAEFSHELELLTDDDSDWEDVEDELLIAIHKKRRVDPKSMEPLPAVINLHRTIDSFHETETKDLFRFKKEQIKRLYAALEFPAEFHFEGCKFTGEEILLAGLYRMAQPRDSTGWAGTFGWLQSRASKAFKLYLNFMDQNWIYLINDNVNYWSPMFPTLAEGIRLKLNSEGCTFAEGNFRIIGFIDCTHMETCRPGSGPCRKGKKSKRKHKLIQRAFYNGWKKAHGLKVQTVSLPNGMTFHCWGPCSLRHNDITTWHKSKMNDIMVNCQLGRHKQYFIFGDSAYKVLSDSHIAFAFGADNNNAAATFRNSRVNSCRESVEWDYKDIKTTFKGIDYSKN